MKIDARQQAVISIMLLSNMVAFLASGFDSRYLVICIGSFLFFLFAYEKLLTKLRASGGSSSFADAYGKAKNRITALSAFDAKGLALKALSDPQKFVVLKSSRGTPDTESLGPLLKEFFSLYDSVRAVKGDFHVNRSFLATQPNAQGMLKIGTDIGHAEYFAKPRSDEIIEPDGLDTQVHWPSIYHLIVITDWVLTTDK